LEGVVSFLQKLLVRLDLHLNEVWWLDRIFDLAKIGALGHNDVGLDGSDDGLRVFRAGRSGALEQRVEGDAFSPLM
jgi:hypothetical protein